MIPQNSVTPSSETVIVQNNPIDKDDTGIDLLRNEDHLYKRGELSQRENKSGLHSYIHSSTAHGAVQ